jgi:hypothetical protein
MNVKKQKGGGNTIRVTMPLKNGTTIEVEGELPYVKSTIGQLDELFDILKTAVGEVSITTAPLTVESDTTSSEVPAIPQEFQKDLRRALVFLAESPWGRIRPRKFSEFMEALKISTVYRTKGSVAGALNALTEQNRIRRLRSEKGDFEYTPVN